MRIDLVNGKVLFNGVPFAELELEERLEADKLVAEIKREQSLSDAIEIAKAKARELGFDLRVRINTNII